MRNIGLQLYSLRDMCARDMTGALREVAAMGYTGVEFAGYAGMEAESLRSTLQSLGLSCCGAHVGIDAILDDFRAVVDFAHRLGNRYVVCPALPAEYHGSRKAWERAAIAFESIGRRLAEEDLVFAYHTHGYCFEDIEGTPGIELLLANTSPEYVKLQQDVGNADCTGRCDSLDFISRHADRVELLHIKDYRAVGDERPVAVGEGAAPWGDILRLCARLGVKQYVVEYEGEDAAQMCERSVRYLKGLSL